MSRSAFNSSWISRFRSPLYPTEPTSLTVSRSCFTRFSVISVISLGARGPYTANPKIGCASGSIFVICSGRVSRGNWLTICASLSRTSWVAASMSRSRVKVIVTREFPWSDDARSSSMPLIVLTASSMRFVIVVSISSALAPGRFAWTDTIGASVFGIRSRPSDSYDTAPSTMSAAVIMIAKTGRRTLTSASFIRVRLCGRRPVRLSLRTRSLLRRRHGPREWRRRSRAD